MRTPQYVYMHMCVYIRASAHAFVSMHLHAFAVSVTVVSLGVMVPKMLCPTLNLPNNTAVFIVLRSATNDHYGNFGCVFFLVISLLPSHAPPAKEQGITHFRFKCMPDRLIQLRNLTEINLKKLGARLLTWFKEQVVHLNVGPDSSRGLNNRWCT